MLFKTGIVLLLSVTVVKSALYAQAADSARTGVLDLPSRLFARLQKKTADLNQQLTKQTEKYLQKMARREARLKEKLYKVDSNAARNLFSGSSQQQYAALAQRMEHDTGGHLMAPTGEYLANADSQRVSLAFLQQHPDLLGVSPGGSLSSQARTQLSQLEGSTHELQQLQARMDDAGQVREFISQRKEQIKEYLSRFTNMPSGITKEYQGLNEDLYYYSQRVEQYKQMLNDPDKMEKQALSLLNQLPAFRQFMQNNSQLATLFGAPGSSGAAQSLAGLQTRAQMQQIIQGQLSAGGSNAMGAFQDNLQSAQTQLNQLKDKLNRLGTGGKNVDAPNFKPNQEKTKTFLQRLEYGINLQTSRTNAYYPTILDIGASVGYKLNASNSLGIGASYKMGTGNGFQHIAFSSQGAGLRSYLDIKIKGTFSATGGLEYNYATPFSSLGQIKVLDRWSQSGLIGISKTVSVKSRLLKNTKLSLLWDFLSYRQTPKTQPLLVRVGYGF